MPNVLRYEIRRGRQTELDKTGTGTAVITLADTNGSLDPASGGTGYDPMTPVAIALTNPVTSASSPIFTGHVSRWGYDLYETEQFGIATIECVDAMEILAACDMKVGYFGDARPVANAGDVFYDVDQEVKHRIDHVLDDVGWPVGNREVFTGNCRLKSTVYAPRNAALTAINDAAEAEFPGGVSNFYMQKDGKATFHGRLARFNPTDAQYHITTWRVGDIAAFNADSTRAVIFDLDYDRDKNRIINHATATPEGIAEADIEGQVVEDAASQAAYGTRSWSAENLLTDYGWLTGNDDLTETLLFADYYVTNYASPQTRINRISFKTIPPTHAYAANVWALMCGVDISDRLLVKTTHAGGGFNDVYYFVEGLTYVAEALNDQYLNVRLDLDVSPAAYWTTLPS